MRNLFTVLILALPFFGLSQSDTTGINSLINSSFPDNTSGAITPEDLRDVSRELMRSNSNKLERNVFAEPIEISDSVKSTQGFYRWTGTEWVESGNVYAGSEWMVSAEITTTISTVNTPVKINGKTDYTNEISFYGGSTDNELTYTGTEQIVVLAIANLSLTGDSGDDIGLLVRMYDSSASGYVELNESPSITLTSGEIQNATITAIATMNNLDRIELWVENRTDNSDVTMLIDSHCVAIKMGN